MTWRDRIRNLIRTVEYHCWARDYYSPELDPLPASLQKCFPEVVRERPNNIWVPHFLRVDPRYPQTGLVSWDEAGILYNYASRSASLSFLEIGCWEGWSTLSLALAGPKLTVIDPVLDGAPQGQICRQALAKAGLTERVELVPGYSPQCVDRLAKQGRRWSVFFIDGDHEGSAPLLDAQVCAAAAECESIVILHDAILPSVGDALQWLETQGWETGVHYTANFLGVAWRGSTVRPLIHVPDPRVRWSRLIRWRWPHLSRFKSLQPSRSE